jgi:predicted ATP-dependent serine protease
MKSYDRWITEGDDHTCTCCGYVYTDSDGGCPACQRWSEGIANEIYKLAQKLKDSELLEFMCDDDAIETLTTRDQWTELLEETQERAK